MTVTFYFDKTTKYLKIRGKKLCSFDSLSYLKYRNFDNDELLSSIIDKNTDSQMGCIYYKVGEFECIA